MNIYQCQTWAKNNGFDNAEFYAEFPAGKLKCKWLDAYFGFFEVPGFIDKNFLSVDQIDEMFPNLVCELIKQNENIT